MERILKNLCPKQGGFVAAVTLVCLLTSGLPAAAQTDPETAPPAPPAYPADEPVCGWDNVEDDPRLARVCLQKAGVNAGLAEYAFAEIPLEYDPDEPTLSGTPEEAGLVSRWAMGEAIHRMIETAVEAAGEKVPGLPDNHQPFFTDIGWLSADTQRKLELLFDWNVTTGTDVFGEYSPTQTLTRRQMALFFVRALKVIDETTGGAGTPGFAAAETWKTLGEETDAYEIGAPFADVQAGERPPATLSRHFLGSVSLLYDLGITRGARRNSEGELIYHPYKAVTGGQMALFVVRLLAHTSIRVTDDQPDLAAVELPAVQQEENTPRLGTRTPAGSSLSIEEIDKGLRGHNEPLPALTAVRVRPPREIDIYRYYAFRSEVPAYNEQLQLSERFSLQVGDWYWNDPPHTDYEHRTRYVLMEFRTAVGYRDVLPYTAAFFCMIPEGSPGPESAPESTRYEWNLKHVLPSGPGLFRLMLGTYADETFRADAGYCDLGEYDVPVPAGGYTERFPCEGSWPAHLREAWGDPWDGRLLPCQT